MKIFIKNATVINEGKSFCGSVLIVDDIIKNVFENPYQFPSINADKIIDASGLLLMPGVIDGHVHFREPGMTHKADIHSETVAAAAGGVTSFMDMPNNIPAASTIENLEKKYAAAKEKSLINYSFYLGATNENISEIKQIDANSVCGVKIFMGSSTGNMLVDDKKHLEKIFAESPVLIAVHCEDENIICQNITYYKNKFGDSIPFAYHSKIRSGEACVKSAKYALELACKYSSRMHILHVSTANEIELLSEHIENKQISAETCTHYLWFCDCDCETLKWKIKCNPSIKTQTDRNALRQAVERGIIKIVSTDHAPHLFDEKNNDYLKCPSGLPSVQHSLNVMLELVKQNILKLETVIECMCHNPARVFAVEKRGFICENYKADIVLVNPNAQHKVEKSNILYKCGWSPFENITFNSQVTYTFVNGKLVYDNGKINETVRGERLIFERK